MANNSQEQKPQENKSSEKLTLDTKPQWYHRKKTGLIIGLVIIVVLLILGIGLAAFGVSHLFKGQRKMAYSEMRFKSGRNFQRGPGFGEDFARGERGLVEVTKISGNNLTVKTNDNKELSVQVSSTTSYYKNQDIAKQSDLQVGNKIMILGHPDSNSVIQAQVIRIQS